MSPPRRALFSPTRVAALAAAVAAVLGAGCTPGAGSNGDADEPTADQLPSATVTIPPVRLSAFCQAMIELADRLVNDPPDDVEAAIIETYADIEDEVPDAIRQDFDAVLADLRGDDVPGPAATDAATEDGAEDAPATTVASGPPETDASGSILPAGDPFFDEGYGPDDSPALRLNAYVDFECRDVANNPGPPATQPLTDISTTEP